MCCWHDDTLFVLDGYRLAAEGTPSRLPLCCCLFVQRAKDFIGTHFGGQMCGVTVLTTVVFVQTYELFSTIAVPIAESMNAMGIPAMFQFLEGDLAR